MKSAVLINLLFLLTYINCQESDCEKHPCANNGVCHEFSTGRECVCQLGYGGIDCTMDLCTSKPCFNDATCVRGQNTRYCICPLGFSGEDCSVEECVAHPCRNGATCIPKYKDRQCICPLGFKGADCEIDICKIDPCLHDGQCIPAPNSTSCVCQIGYTGRFCETVACDPNPCLNGRTCKIRKGDYYCQCNHEGGQRCQYGDVFSWPWNRRLLPKTLVLPDTQTGFIYVPNIGLITRPTVYMYGLSIVTTGNPTPFYVQIWRHHFGDHRANLTLEYSERISLSTKKPVQQIKFSDHGIKCGAARVWDRVGFYFPEGPSGIGLQDQDSNIDDCGHFDCGVFIYRNSLSNISIGETVQFEVDLLKNFMYTFGVKFYFALEGEHGRELDSNSCPVNTELPEETFGDSGDIIDTKEYSFSFPTAFSTKDETKRNVSENKGASSDSVVEIGSNTQTSASSDLILIGAPLGGLLFILLIVITVLAIKLAHQHPTPLPEMIKLRPPPLPDMANLPSRKIDNQTSPPTDRYTDVTDNSNTVDMIYSELDNNDYYETPRDTGYMDMTGHKTSSA